VKEYDRVFVRQTQHAVRGDEDKSHAEIPPLDGAG